MIVLAIILPLGYHPGHHPAYLAIILAIILADYAIILPGRMMGTQSSWSSCHHPGGLCHHPDRQDDSFQKNTKTITIFFISANHPAWQDDWPAGQDESSWFGPIILPHVQACLLR